MTPLEVLIYSPMFKRSAIIFVVLLACGGKQGLENAKVKPSEDWMGIYIDKAKIGYVYSKEEAAPEGYRFTQKSMMRLELLGSDESFATNLEALTDENLNLQEFTFDISSRQHNFYAEGRREGDKLKLKVKSAGRTETREVQADELMISPALGHWVMAQDPEPDEKYTVTVFEPTLLRKLPLTVKVLGTEKVLLDGEPVPALKLETRMMGLTSQVWLDSLGTSIKEFQQPGITMIREPKEKALAGVSDAAKLDLLSFFAVKPDSAITNPRGLSELKLRLKGLDAALDLEITSSAQKASRLDTGTVELVITFPDTGSIQSTTIPMSQPSEFLTSSLYIQTEDPEIKETAKKIVGSQKDAMSAAAMLVTWVHRNLSKRATASVPSAVDVLASREGDCNEHAILLAALGRAAGIPTKINVGLVYLNRAFYYHAWNSFWIGDTWVPADATFEQLPADPTHLQLHEGELDEQAKVLSVVGNLEIEVISFR